MHQKNLKYFMIIAFFGESTRPCPDACSLCFSLPPSRSSRLSAGSQEISRGLMAGPAQILGAVQSILPCPLLLSSAPYTLPVWSKFTLSNMPLIHYDPYRRFALYVALIPTSGYSWWVGEHGVCKRHDIARARSVHENILGWVLAASAKGC